MLSCTLWKKCSTEASFYFLVGDRHVQLVCLILIAHKEQSFLTCNLNRSHHLRRFLGCLDSSSVHSCFLLLQLKKYFFCSEFCVTKVPVYGHFHYLSLHYHSLWVL